jgi:hypothetical protein
VGLQVASPWASFVTALRSLGQNVDEAEARRFLEDAGVAVGAGDLHLAAFLAVAARKMGSRQSEARLAKCFDVFDDACSGSIPAEQLRQVMVSHDDRLTEEKGLRWGRGRMDCSGFFGGRREAGAVYNRDLIVSRDLSVDLVRTLFFICIILLAF